MCTYNKCVRITNVYVYANICSIRISHCTIFGGRGNNFDQKLGPNSRMVARTSLLMAPTCFLSNFTHQYATCGKILKTLKMKKRTLVSFGAKFHTLSLFAGDMAAKTIFKLSKFKFVVKIEIAKYYETLDAILRLFSAKFLKRQKL